MEFGIGKVFSDGIQALMARKGSEAGGGTIDTRRAPAGGAYSPTVEAARIRADSAAADRDRKERATNRSLDIREGDLARKTTTDARNAKIREVAAQMEMELRGVRTWQDGVKVVDRLMRSAREKDAYGRIDPEQVKLYSDLLDQVKTHLLAPPAQGGLGLPPGDLVRVISGYQRELAGNPDASPEMGDLGGAKGSQALTGAGNPFAKAAASVEMGVGAAMPVRRTATPEWSDMSPMAEGRAAAGAGLTSAPGMADTSQARAPGMSSPGMGEPYTEADLVEQAWPHDKKPPSTP